MNEAFTLAASSGTMACVTGCYSYVIAQHMGAVVSRERHNHEMTWGCVYCGSVMSWRPEKESSPRKCTSCGAPRRA